MLDQIPNTVNNTQRFSHKTWGIKTVLWGTSYNHFFHPFGSSGGQNDLEVQNDGGVNPVVLVRTSLIRITPAYSWQECCASCPVLISFKGGSNSAALLV